MGTYKNLWEDADEASACVHASPVTFLNYETTRMEGMEKGV